MKIFSNKYICRILAFLTINAFFTAGTAVAADGYRFSQTALSPKITLITPAFSELFEEQAALKTELLNKPDLTTNRQKFQKEFFDLKLKILFPEVIQYHLIRAIKEQMLSGINENAVNNIQASFKTSDHPYINHVYELFQKLGEKNFDKIVRATWSFKRQVDDEEKKIIEIAGQIIDNLLVYDTNKRHDLVGLKPPRARTEKGRKRREAIIKKWLVDTMPGFTGYSKKELKGKNNRQLWLLYYKFKLPHAFGKELIAEMDRGSNVVFDVEVTLNNGTVKHNEIRIEEAQDIWKAFLVKQNKQDGSEKNALSNIPKKEKDCIFDELPQNLHQTIHILQSRRKELHFTMKHLDSLKLVRDISRKGFASNKEFIQTTLEEVYQWAKAARENKQKIKVRDNLKKVLSQRGYLKKGDYLRVMLMVQDSIQALKERIKRVESIRGKPEERGLLPMILNLTLSKLIPAFDKTNSNIVRVEILKNLFIEIEYYVRQEMFEKALEKENISANYTSDAHFQKYMFNNYWEVINKVRTSILKGESGEPYLKVLSLSNDVRNHLQLLEFSINDLSAFRDKLNRWGGWKVIPNDLESMRALLSGISKPKARQKEILDFVLNGGEHPKLGKLRGLEEVISSLGRNPEGAKRIILNTLWPIKKNLYDILKAIQARNQAIRQAFPEVKDITVEKAEMLAAEKLKEFDRKQGISTGQIIASLVENLRGIEFILSDYQNANSNNNMRPIGDIVSGVPDDFTKQDAALQLIGQAI